MSRIRPGTLVVMTLSLLLTGCPDSGPPSIVFDGTGQPDQLPTDGVVQSEVVAPEGCESDADCPAGKCNPFSHTCVDCFSSDDCPDGQKCEKWSCVELPPCAADEDCPDGLVCAAEEGVCVDCVDDEDCGELAECVDGECIIPCGEECPPGMLCDQITDTCVECLDDEDCAIEEFCFLQELQCYMDQCEPGIAGCVGQQTAVCAGNGSGWVDLEWCPDGLICKAGLCVDDCIPNCQGKECGSDGCGGSCGTCVEGTHCGDDDQCHPGICALGQTACNDGGLVKCLGPEEGWSKPEKCPPGTVCEDGQCKADKPWECQPGEIKCDGNEIVICNPDGIGWNVLVDCPAGTWCDGGECIPVQMGNCQQALECMMEFPCDEPDFGCFEQCLLSSEPPELAMELFYCVFDFCNGWDPDSQCFKMALGEMCFWAYDECMDEPWQCDPGEMACEGNAVLVCGGAGEWQVEYWCPAGTFCDNGDCIPGVPSECAEILGCMMEFECYEPEPVCMEECIWTPGMDVPDLVFELYFCVFETCGMWNPGGECFEFALFAMCGGLYEECFGACAPQCQGKQCGEDGCGGWCGDCPSNLQCSPAGKCEPPCQPKCGTKECGTNGCGGNCGVCPVATTCKNGVCVQSCNPNCEDKECGSDGCGGSCGLCPGGMACKYDWCEPSMSCEELTECMWDCPPMDQGCNTECWQESSTTAKEQWWAVAECVGQVCGENGPPGCFMDAIQNKCQGVWEDCQDCTAACEGKQCGMDGCGGSCGDCPAGFMCDDFGSCLCQPQCEGIECGTDGCGGSCGGCPPGDVCNFLGFCICNPKCGGKQCGPDGCGGNCGQCPPGFGCTPNFKCKPGGPNQCGNGICQAQLGEGCQSCPQDCECGGDCCEMHEYPGCENPEIMECVCQFDEFCCFEMWDEICVDEAKWDCGLDCGGGCEPNCFNKECGPDGCESSCGSCPMGTTCNKGGICQQVCKPDCEEVECGSDGCGGSCGLCSAGMACKYGDCIVSMSCAELVDCQWSCPEYDEECQAGCSQDASPAAKEQWWAVVGCIMEYCPEGSSPDCAGEVMQGACADEWYACQECTPDCEGKQCGDNGCGGDCGECPGGYACDNFGYCLCQPYCDGKQCGNDGCGGSCGTCGAGDVCNYMGKCVCMPKCQNKQCGPDACGGSCGQCPQGLNCTPNGQCKPGGNQQCGNGMCQPALGESCDTCPQDCPCGGECCQPHDFPGCDDPEVMECVCSMDKFCCAAMWDEICVSQAQEACGLQCDCISNCQGKECGGDGCGGSCGLCPPGSACMDNGTCSGSGDGCGNDMCQQWMGEDCQTCPEDCGPCGCGDDQCSAEEDCVSCPTDCGPCLMGDCCEAHKTAGCEDEAIVDCVCEFDPFCCMVEWDDLCADQGIKECGLDCGDPCEPQCFTEEGIILECGDDGCGGSCGQCKDNAMCVNGHCVAICQPQCYTSNGNKLECGSDGCGGSCGQCEAGEECVNGKCVSDCQPQCVSADGQQIECGDDGCGGSCGICEADQNCSGGQCVDLDVCGDMLDCALECGFQFGCVWNCYGNGSNASQALFQSVALCVIQDCGFGISDQCIQESLAGACLDENQACLAD